MFTRVVNASFDFSLNAPFNPVMDKDESARVIDAAGGDRPFGKLIGIDGIDGFVQRVNNWRRRGMPAQIVLEHYELIQELKAKAQSDAANRAAS